MKQLAFFIVFIIILSCTDVPSNYQIIDFSASNGTNIIRSLILRSDGLLTYRLAKSNQVNPISYQLMADIDDLQMINSFMGKTLSLPDTDCANYNVSDAASVSIIIYKNNKQHTYFIYGGEGCPSILDSLANSLINMALDSESKPKTAVKKTVIYESYKRLELPPPPTFK